MKDNNHSEKNWYIHYIDYTTAYIDTLEAVFKKINHMGSCFQYNKKKVVECVYVDDCGLAMHQISTTGMWIKV